MENRIIAIIDREEGYAARLAEMFNNRDRVGFRAQMFSGVERFLEYCADKSVEILLVGESLMDSALYRAASLVVVITEGNLVREAQDTPVVYKYQSSETIMKQVLDYYARDGRHVDRTSVSRTLLYGVYAPQNRELKSGFAWNLARYLGRTKRVLYMGLNGFNPMMELYHNEKDLADVMYYVRNGFDNLVFLVGSSVMTVESVDCMPVMRSLDDLLQVTAQEWLRILQVIMSQSDYEAVVLDLDECVQQFYRLLDECAVVYMPFQDNVRSDGKWVLCREYFERVGAKDVWTKAEQIRVDADGWRTDIESITGI